MTWRSWSLIEPFRNMGGDVSFTKLLICCFVLMHWNGHAPSVLSETLLLSAAFGKSTWESFLQRGQWSANAQESVTTSVEERVTVAGEPGIQPAP